MSEVTRLLSIGAHLDREFADRVIDELLENRQRKAAPAYGYDAATVLGHALAARRLRGARRGVVVTALLLWFAVGVLGSVWGSFGATVFWTATVIALWAAWASLLIEKIVVRQIVTVHLRVRSRPGARYGFDGEPPQDPEDMAEQYREIREEQDPTSGVVHYGGYVPFVGAGDLQRSWSFAVLLDGRAAGAHSALRPTGTAPDGPPPPEDAGARRPDPRPFTGAELTAYVRDRLTSRLLTEVDMPDQRLDGLEVTKRLYVRADGPAPPDTVTLASAERYDGAREFLVVRVGSWQQELVLTVFLNVDLKGRVLYTQLHGYQLLPIRAAYHEADRLSRGVDGRVLGTLAGKALTETLLGGLASVFRSPRPLVTSLKRRQGWSGGLRAITGSDEEERAFGDWGALSSVRELGASGGYHHYYQQMDSAKYLKVIERRTLEVILDFLDSRDVDTAEFRARQAEVLNVGILQTGGGTIVNSGATAVGRDASASATTARRAT
ncbi:hypothetical protein [Streptomyces lichenis]|uniref:DUF2207 domain-containing protein n=1 Tax=Streptomyces lichenis TaxID=2306967 RepID=A0ABT0IDT2_9ACTN|nr:hypothetical protein [Streptomyces lichenis]MCK8679491.1 hypothetical protein [Streptomyces lichenis]